MCLSFSIGIGIYWIAGALVRSVQQVIISRHMSSIDMDEVIHKNQEKAAKKREKSRRLPAAENPQAATREVCVIFRYRRTKSRLLRKKRQQERLRLSITTAIRNTAPGIAAKANMSKTV